ncbi:hypothetical protein ATANTOWER_016263 [Ataeniobius toweri]|uniref:DUF7789 domain-containing protein n=1 Tax=Ataeniobius toweri TaxID=208326 RepID=A0ABU7BRL5_9TELE|nr:hypothetical protein [Ataeniobius toweri]
MYLPEIFIMCSFQSFVGQPAAPEPRSSVSEPEAETPESDSYTMWTGEQICLLYQHQRKELNIQPCHGSAPIGFMLIKLDFAVFRHVHKHTRSLSTPSILQIKAWSELSNLVKTYFCFSIVSLLALLGLTVSSVYKQHKNTEVSDEDNFTVSLVQLVGILFCIYYISRGVLQENRQELVVFVLSVLVVMIRSVVNFSVVGSEGKQEVLLWSLWILKVVVLPCQRGAGGTGGRD